MQKSIITFFLYYLTSWVGLSTGAKRAMYVGIEKYSSHYNMPKLPFKFTCMEPWIDSATMKEHYFSIHAEFSVSMNKLLKEWRTEVKA